MLILLVLLIFFAALGIPLAFAIGASCVTYILIYAPTFITMLPQRVWNGAYSELMIAIGGYFFSFLPRVANLDFSFLSVYVTVGCSHSPPYYLKQQKCCDL